MTLLHNWFAFSIIAGLTSSFSSILTRYVFRRGESALAFAWFFHAMRFGLFLLLAWFEPTPHFTSTTISLLLLIGGIEIISIYLDMKKHQTNDLSVSVIISRSRFIWVAIFSYFVLGETLTPKEYLAIAFLSIGLFFAIRPDSLKLDDGIKIALLSTFVIAIVSVLMKQAVYEIPVATLMACISLPSTFAYPLVVPQARNAIKTRFTSLIGFKILAVVFHVLAMYTYVYALKIGPVSKVTPVSQSMMIFSVLASIIFLKERQRVRDKVIGTVFSLAAIYALK